MIRDAASIGVHMHGVFGWQDLLNLPWSDYTAVRQMVNEIVRAQKEASNG